MVGGIVTGVSRFKDRVRLTVNGTDHDSHQETVKEIYPTEPTKGIRPGDEVWWQSGLLLWSGRELKDDVKLVLIRQNDGDEKPWPYEKAAKMAGVNQPT